MKCQDFLLFNIYFLITFKTFKAYMFRIFILSFNTHSFIISYKSQNKVINLKNRMDCQSKNLNLLIAFIK